MAEMPNSRWTAPLHNHHHPIRWTCRTTGLKSLLHTAWRLARTKIAEAQEHYKKQYDKKAKQPAYRVGDRVFIYMPQMQQGQLRELAGPYCGLCRVEAVTGMGAKKLTPSLQRKAMSQWTGYIQNFRHWMQEMGGTRCLIDWHVWYK